MYGSGPYGAVLGAQAATDTPSLDLPAGLQNLLSMPLPAAQQTTTFAPIPMAAGNPSAPVFDIHSQPGFAVGGMVGPQGMPVPPGMPQQGMPQQGAITSANVAQFVQQHPQQAQQIAQQVQQAVQSGEVDIAQLQQAAQLAKLALDNPQMYPRLRQHAIQQGLADEQDLPPQFDPGFLFTLLLAAQVAQNAAPTVGVGGIPSHALGGPVNSGIPITPPTEGGDDVLIAATRGEYVIPPHVVEMKGREFFDKLLEQYAQDRVPDARPRR